MEEAPGATVARYALAHLAVPHPGGTAAAEFVAVYREHFEFVWRTVTGLAAGSGVSVEDAVQDLWLAVARRLPEFRGESSHRTWLFAVARNVVRNHRRAVSRKGGLEPLDDTSPWLGHHASEETLEAAAVWGDVKRFMTTLDETLREIFLCRFLLEMTPREVATVTGRSVIFVYTATRQLKSAFRRWHESRLEELP